ncbi:hypothetical protein ACTFIV_011072 [Dictyostelium citrinum]
MIMDVIQQKQKQNDGDMDSGIQLIIFSSNQLLSSNNKCSNRNCSNSNSMDTLDSFKIDNGVIVVQWTFQDDTNPIKPNQTKPNQNKSNQIQSNPIKSNPIQSNQIQSNQIKSK